MEVENHVLSVFIPSGPGEVLTTNSRPAFVRHLLCAGGRGHRDEWERDSKETRWPWEARTQEEKGPDLKNQPLWEQGFRSIKYEAVWERTGRRAKAQREEAHIWAGQAGWMQCRAKEQRDEREGWVWKTLRLPVWLQQKVHGRGWLEAGCHTKGLAPYRHYESTGSS